MGYLMQSGLGGLVRAGLVLAVGMLAAWFLAGTLIGVGASTEPNGPAIYRWEP